MSLIELPKYKLVAQIFENFTALASVYPTEINKERWEQTSTSRIGSPSKMQNWYGFESFEELRWTIEVNGWVEGLSRGVNLFGEIQPPKLPSYKRKRCKGMTGHTLNITSLYNGNFNKAWNTAKKIPTSDRTKRSGKVNIIVQINAYSNVSPEQFFWRGVVGCLLAKALQKSGRNVSIYAGSSSKEQFEFEEFKYSVTLVKLKDYGYPLEMERLFAMTATSAFFRYYIFKAYCAYPFLLDHGFGVPHQFKGEYIQELLCDDAPAIIISNIWNLEQAKTALDNLLKAYA